MQKIAGLDLSTQSNPCRMISDMITSNFAGDGTDKSCPGPLHWSNEKTLTVTEAKALYFDSKCSLPGGENLQADGPVIAFSPADFSNWRDNKPNMTAYDIAIGVPSPFVFVFSEVISNETGALPIFKHTPFMTCIPADSVVDGSRKLGTKDKEGAASKEVGGFGMSAFAVAGLTVLFAMNI
jgi:hypothetical protein